MFDGMPAGVHSSLCEVLVSQPDSLDIMEKTGYHGSGNLHSQL